MKIGIAIPIYLNGKTRNIAYERVIHHYAKSGYPVHVCGSEGRVSVKFFSQFKYDNVKYIEVPQMHPTRKSSGDDSLRLKFNQSLFSLGPMDWYVLVGADDAAPLSVFSGLSSLDPKRVYMVGVGSSKPLLIRELKSGRSVKVKLNYEVDLLPGINIFSLGAMLRSEFKPYQLQGCETGAERYFRSCGQIVQLDGYIVMLKGEGCLNSFEKILRVHPYRECNDSEIQLIDGIQ